LRDRPLLELELATAGVTSIIWATGFTLDYSWLQVNAFDENGKPKHQRGVSSEPGVYFLGLPWLSCRGSSFIWGSGTTPSTWPTTSRPSAATSPTAPPDAPSLLPGSDLTCRRAAGLPRLPESGVILQITYTDPDAVLTVDFAGGEVHEGGPVDVRPNVEMFMSADNANQFWLGQLNLSVAMAKGQVRTKGPVSKILKLVPIAKELFPPTGRHSRKTAEATS
jgi:putative sterol carrier protein